MSRTLVAILLLFAMCTVVAQGVLAYKLNAVQTLVAEEETHDSKPLGKAGKIDDKESYFYSLSLHQRSVSDQLNNASAANDLRYFKGFAQTPYLPPDVI
jgi:hypothetical protein